MQVIMQQRKLLSSAKVTSIMSCQVRSSECSFLVTRDIGKLSKLGDAIGFLQGQLADASYSFGKPCMENNKKSGKSKKNESGAFRRHFINLLAQGDQASADINPMRS